MIHPILIVEDEPAMRLLVEEYLKLLGYPVLTAADGAGALEQADTRPLSLAFVDINLPDFSGVDLMRRMRESGVTCPLVVMSGNLRETFAEAVAPLGVAEVLEKPVDLDDLEALILRLVGPGAPTEDPSAA